MGGILWILESHSRLGEIIVLAGRNAGPFRFVETTPTLKTDDLRKTHRISDEIETTIPREMPHVERILIHAEPCSPTRHLVAVRLIDPGASHWGRGSA